MPGIDTTREARRQERLRYDVAAQLHDSALKAHELNEYGSVVGEGYKVEDGPEGAARVSHKLPEADLSDPYRMSSDERWWVRLGMLARYAEALRRGGFDVTPGGVNGGVYEPWLIVRRGEEASDG